MAVRCVWLLRDGTEGAWSFGMGSRLRSSLVALSTIIAACGARERGPVDDAYTSTDAASDAHAPSMEAAPDAHAPSMDGAPDEHTPSRDAPDEAAVSMDASSDEHAPDASAPRDSCAFSGDSAIRDVATIDVGAGCSPGLVWTDTSVRLTLRRWGYVTSPCPYQADRCEMSDVILSALHGLCPIPRPQQSGYDMPNYRVEITDADGTLTAYRAWGRNVVDRDNPDPTLPTIDVASVERLVKVLGCTPR